MSNTASAKGNPAWKRMTNPNYKAKRARNKARNERLRAMGQHPKQLRDAENVARSERNKRLMDEAGLTNRKQASPFHSGREVTANKRTMNDLLPLTHLNAKTGLSGPMFKNVARLLDDRHVAVVHGGGKCKC